MKIERHEIDENTFHILADGEIKFVCEREHVMIKGEARRGYWLMKMPTPAGLLVVERDQYSNDLIEWAGIHLDERRIYGKRFQIECFLASEFKANVERWLIEISSAFEGEWSAEFDSYRNMAVFERDDV